VTTVEIVLQLAMGIGLAAAAGLRAFLPPLVVGLAARADLITLGERFTWMETTPALLIMAVAVVVEMLGDKFPVVDHALDTVGTVARPVAGALVATSAITALDPVTGAVIGVMVGGSVAGGVHALKAMTRLLSTGATAGIANPVVSLLEDGVSLSASVLAILAPFVAAAIVIGLAVVLLRRSRRRR